MVNLKVVAGGQAPRYIGLGFHREPSSPPVILDEGAAVWHSTKVPGLILETVGVDGERPYVLRLDDVVVRAWYRQNGWPSQFRAAKKWKHKPSDPGIQIGDALWHFEFDPTAKDTARITVGEDTWVLKRVRLLKFRLTRQGDGDEVFFGPNIGARGLHSGEPVTVALACMLQLLHVEQSFSTNFWVLSLAASRRLAAY
jgi:hypothetical protein